MTSKTQCSFSLESLDVFFGIYASTDKFIVHLGLL
jgi:hypothetical protein